MIVGSPDFDEPVLRWLVCASAARAKPQPNNSVAHAATTPARMRAPPRVAFTSTPSMVPTPQPLSARGALQQGQTY